MSIEALASYTKYDSYKHSGVDWLGKIPKDWELVKFKYIFSEVNVRSETGEETLLSVSQYTGVTKKRSKDSSDILSNALSLEGYKLVKANQLVSNIMLAWNGSLAFSKYNGIVSPAYSVYDLKAGMSLKFFSYLLRSEAYKAEYKRKSTGVIDSRLRLYSDSFYSIWSAIPNRQEQEKIGNFLKYKIGQIDQAINLKQQQIEKLNEYKQVTIQNAVTKGLDANARMKDSGIDWIGNIPEHWDCTAIKRLLSIPITDGPHTTPEFYDKGIPFISAESIKNGVINFDKKRGYISILDYEKYSKKYKPQKYDIYMVKSGATTGRVAMVDTDKVFTIWSPLAVFRTKKNTLLPKFLYMYLQSKSLQKGIELSWTFGTQQNIGMGVLGNLHCVVPTLEEQDEIIIYLDSVLSKVDATRDSYLAQIERLKEYKTILINQAVTGKIKVS